MAKGEMIELQRPLGYNDGVTSTSAPDNEEVTYNLGNQHDQADMFRLGKKQKLDVRRVVDRQSSRDTRLIFAA